MRAGRIEEADALAERERIGNDITKQNSKHQSKNQFQRYVGGG